MNERDILRRLPLARVGYFRSYGADEPKKWSADLATTSAAGYYFSPLFQGQP
jgi:hypothetical protein